MCDGTGHPDNSLAFHWFTSLEIKLSRNAAHFFKTLRVESRVDGPQHPRREAHHSLLDVFRASKTPSFETSAIGPSGASEHCPIPGAGGAKEKTHPALSSS